MEEQQLPCREIKINLSINQQDKQKDVKTKRGDSASVGVKEQELTGRDLSKKLRRISYQYLMETNQHVTAGKQHSQHACIDQAPATPGYKLLQLRQHLTGEALKCIKNLGHSA